MPAHFPDAAHLPHRLPHPDDLEKEARVIKVHHNLRALPPADQGVWQAWASGRPRMLKDGCTPHTSLRLLPLVPLGRWPMTSDRSCFSL